MSDRGTHVSFGVLLSVGMGVLLSYLSTSDPVTMVACAIVGGFWGSTFPDLVEPPDTILIEGSSIAWVF